LLGSTAMKPLGIVIGTALLVPLGLAAQAQGTGAAESGAALFAQCKICHSLEAGKNMVGPSLHGIIGRESASEPGYAYSAAMKSAALIWNDDTLRRYLTDPKAVVPGGKMAFPGIKDPDKLADLLAYLAQATR
jgi:cytochrome c2